MRFRDRPVGELMTVAITFTVCFGVLGSGLLIGIIYIFRPEVNVQLWVIRVTSLMNTMVGLLAGYLAGRTDRRTLEKPEKPPEDPA